MNAVFENDPSRGPGYGLLRFSELDSLPSSPTFSLQRSADGLYLGQSQWQEAEERLAPLEHGMDGTTLTLAVSPSVVDQLNPLATCRVTLHGLATPLRATLQLDSVIYSPLARSASLHEITPPPRPVVSPPKPEPAPEPAPAPVLAEPLNMPAPAAPKRVGLLLFGLAAALLLAGAGGWLYYDFTRTQAEQTVETAKAQEKDAATLASEQADAERLAAAKAEADKKDAEQRELERLAAETAGAEKKAAEEKAATEKAAAEKTATEKAEADKATAEKAKGSAKDQARAFLRGQGTPAAAVTLAKNLPTATADDQDAIFLLMEMAASGGDPEAMLAVGRYYNPADAAPTGTIQKDPEQALHWLRQAEKAPKTAAEAKKQLETLVGWLKASSDALARSLLKSME